MNCPSCGAANSEDVRFCGQCGQSLGASAMISNVRARAAHADVGVLSPPPSSSQFMTQGIAPVSGSVSPLSFQPGSSFGRYRIESLLGEGGMGAVYKAQDAELGRTVALKLVRPELATRPETMQRFKQELLLASKISHKNILRIHDLGDIDGLKFITMAFVEGPDLAGLIEKDGRLPLDRALKFAKQLCAALEAAHNEGVVHRDLKPQNILIDRSDTLFVSDFGLAKSLEAEATMLTRTGQILGTPRYMSPEQVEAGSIDHRSDLYAFGLILYEMVTGAMPFRGESTMQLLYQRVHNAPIDPRSSCPELPEYVASIILKCLERDPAKRYQSAHEILADLEAEHGPVTLAAAPGPGAPAAPSTTPAPAARNDKTISIQIPKPTRSGLWKAAAVALVLMASSLLIPGVRHRIFKSGGGGTAATTIQNYMAVLPLRVLGDEQNTGYIAEGVVDAISAKLGGLKNVYVAPASAVAAAAKEQDPQKLAHALGVKMLLKGTVTSGANDNIQITVALDDVTGKGRSLLHQSFSGVRQDLLTLEDQIFNKIVSSLDIKQSNEELARSTKRPTENIGAYDLYLKGRNVLRAAKTQQDLQNAIDMFDQALKADPRFALAFTGMSDAERRMWDQTKDAVWTQKALGAATQAQSIDDNLPEVHFALGSIYTDTGKTEQAIAELQHALTLAPNSDDALRRIGTVYMRSGRQADAITAFAKAAEVNPYLWANFNRLGNAYFQAGQNEQALKAFEKITVLEPARPEGWANMGAVYYRMGKWNECIPYFTKANEVQPKATYYSNLGTTYFYLGKYDEAAAMFERAVAMAPNDASIRRNLADAYRWSGRKDVAGPVYDVAISLAYKLVQVNPKNADALGTLAGCYARKGNSKQALDLIGRARAIDPKSNSLMYEEAAVYVLAGQNTAGLASLEEALTNGYSLEEAMADPELKPLRETPRFERLSKEFSGPPKK